VEIEYGAWLHSNLFRHRHDPQDAGRKAMNKPKNPASVKLQS
jgi:hypothetical protein